MKKLQSLLANQNLLQKILFSVVLLLICRLGAFIPVPGIDSDLAVAYFRSEAGRGSGFFQLLDSFSGGSFSKMSLTALSVFPYITASIALQLLMTIIPSLQREMRENSEVAKRKIGRWTRLLTLALALVESIAFARLALGMNQTHPGIVSPYLLELELFGIPFFYFMIFVVTMSTGTLVLMWMGEQITEFGVGNGISLIISANILASMPAAFSRLVAQLGLTAQSGGTLSVSAFAVLLGLFVLIVAGTIQVTQAQRKIPIQYSRRQVGFSQHAVSSGSSHLPLKLNYAGVLPVICANSILYFPSMIARFFASGLQSSYLRVLSHDHWIGLSIYVFMIIFFSFLWTSSQFNPQQIVSDMKKNGAFIPGVRQGKSTVTFLEETMAKITFFGSFSLAFIAVLPLLITRFFHIDPSIAQAFGGTSLLILVGVIIETARQVDSHLMMDRYQGYMRKKTLRAKRG